MKKIEFRILGPAELRKPDGNLEHSFLAGPKRLALLAFLLLYRPGSFIRRDKILPLLWPNHDQNSARNSLSNMLYHIRKSLGKDLLITRGSEELSVDPNIVWCDVLSFEEAANSGDLLEATTLYRGNLLEGFHLPNASEELENWLEYERSRIHSSYLDALESLAVRCEKSGDYKDSANWWNKILAEDPLDTRVAGKLINALATSGKYSESLRRAKEHAELLAKELDFDPAEVERELTVNLKELRMLNAKASNAPEGQKNTTTIAVLPFEELGDQADISNMSNGLHHDLLTRLARVSNLKVISRTSVIRYKNLNLPIPRIAQELGVDTIVEGAIQKSGAQLRLHIQVIDAKSDIHKIAETFDRNIDSGNLFVVQSELAENIAFSLTEHLTPKEKERVSTWKPTENIEAYRYYSMGRRELDRRTESSMRKSIEYFEKAIDKDDNYALAWVGLSDAWTLLYDYGHESAELTLPKASKAIQRALELDSELAEAHASMGLLHSNRHEGLDAIKALQRAVELQPSYAEAHNWLSWNYQLLGEPDKALKSARQAVELDPLSPEAVSNLAATLLYSGFTQESLNESARTMDLQPEWTTPVFYHALAFYELGNYQRAAELLNGLRAPWAGVGPQATYALCRLKLGDAKTSKKYQASFVSEGKWFAAGLIYAAKGEREEAFNCMMKCQYWDDWPTLSVYYLYQDILNNLRDDIRFNRILKNVKKRHGNIQRNTIIEDDRFDEKIIAVLPFRNLGDSAKTAHFSAGLHMDLIAMISKSSDLTVISSDSMRNIGQGAYLVRDLSAKFGVGTLIKGGVQLNRNRLRLNIQCVNLKNESIHWAETYDRKLSSDNLFEIQSGLADLISKSLHNRLPGSDVKLTADRQTENLDAYLLCVQGKTHLSRRTESSVKKALKFFTRALEKDPDYVLALSGYAETLAIMHEYRYSIPGDVKNPVQMAKKAIEMNPALEEAHTALGILYIQERKSALAIQEFLRAIELKPGSADAHIWLGWTRMISGDIQEAIPPAERAKKLNPMVPYTRAFLGEICLAAGEYEKALMESRAARELQPDYAAALFMEGVSLYHLNRWREAAFVLEEALQFSTSKGTPPSSLIRAMIVVSEAETSIGGEIRQSLSEFKSRRDYFGAGLIHSALGEVENALKSYNLVTSWESFQTAIIQFMLPEKLGPVRRDDRFTELQNQIRKKWSRE